MKKVFDEETCEAILTSAIRICWKMHESATSIIKARVKQKKAFNQRSFSISRIRVGDLILLRNNKRKDREQSFHLHGLVLISFPKLHPKREVTASKKRDGEILKVKYNFSQLKLYVEEKTVDTVSDTTKFTMAVDNENRQSFIQEPAPLWTVTWLLIGILYQRFR